MTVITLFLFYIRPFAKIKRLFAPLRVYALALVYITERSFIMRDYNHLARKIIMTIVQTKSCHSKETISLVLFGSRSKKVVQNRLNEILNYGAFLSEDIDYQKTVTLITFLVDEGLFYENTISNKTFLTLSHKGIAFLIDQDKVLQLTDLTEVVLVESQLEISLKNLRKRLAQEKNVSPFIIFDNKVLRELADKKPLTKESFLKINGLGQLKWEQFGHLVLNICEEK